jgi:hypothetical protein
MLFDRYLPWNIPLPLYMVHPVIRFPSNGPFLSGTDFTSQE